MSSPSKKEKRKSNRDGVREGEGKERALYRTITLPQRSGKKEKNETEEEENRYIKGRDGKKKTKKKGGCTREMG